MGAAGPDQGQNCLPRRTVRRRLAGDGDGPLSAARL